MFPLPPPPPPPHPLSPKQAMSTSLNQIVIPTKAMKQQQILTPEVPTKAMKQQQGTLTPEVAYLNKRKERVVQPVLRRPRRTNPVVWFGAVLCLIFSLLLIFFGIATLVVFLVVKPRTPVFDVSAASLKLIYFDSTEYLNGDFTFLANFSNPNTKVDVRFEYAEIELYFHNSLLATQAIQPFTERQGERKLGSVHMISSLVHVPLNLGLELQKQVQTNRVTYDIRGTFRVKANLGLIHYSYWLHARCQLELSSPPTGVLLAKSCRTKR